MSEYIWRDCKKQPPLVDDGELVLMDSKDKFWVGFCRITSDGAFYFANNTGPLKNDFVKYARIEKLLALETELERTRKALDVAVRAIKTIKYSKKSDAINLRHKANKALIEMYKIKDQIALEQKE